MGKIKNKKINFTILCLIFGIFLVGVFVSREYILTGIGSTLGVQTNLERQEKQIVANKIAEANKFLIATPNPINKISMEGKLDSDPNKVKTIKSLGDVYKIFTLSYVYKSTKDVMYLNKSAEFLLAWTKTYKATGNSIDESHLQQLYDGYGWIRTDLNSLDTGLIDTWLKTIAEKEMVVKFNDGRDTSNWNSHRINIIGQIGYILNDKKYTDYAVSAYKKQIQDNLLPSGESTDFIGRDALHYHSYNIWPLLLLAKTARLHGVDLYNFVSPNGASLNKSLHFLYPYFSGKKSHAEFANSTAAWDITTGSKKNIKYWDPKSDLYILELAYFFENDALPLVQKLRNNKAEYPSYEILLAAQQRREIPPLTN